MKEYKTPDEALALQDDISAFTDAIKYTYAANIQLADKLDASYLEICEAMKDAIAAFEYYHNKLLKIKNAK